MARQTGMKGLQLWCKNTTKDYNGVDITNMSKSFRDGLAFCAIIHRYRPDLIPFETLKKGDVAYNNSLAFKIAEEHFDIPSLLDVEDMVELEIPDRLSIATYLISYYNYFKDKEPVTTPTNNISTVVTTPTNNRIEPTTIKPITTANQSSNHSDSQLKPIKASSGNPPLTKSISSPLAPSTTLNKLSDGITKLQNKEKQGGIPNRPPPPMTTPNKRPLVPSISTGSTPVTTPSAPVTTPSSVTRGRKSKFAATEPVVAMETDHLKPPISNGPPPKPPSRRKSEKRKSVINEICEHCNERVFLMQRLCAEGHIYHRQCFKCIKCNTGLQSKSYEYDIHQDKFYCRKHFQELNRTKSIKRNMIAQGVTTFNDKDLIAMATTKKEHRYNEEWDIINSPNAPPTPTGTKEDELKRDLPSLLSELASKKKQTQSHSKPHPSPIQHSTQKSPIIPTGNRTSNIGGVSGCVSSSGPVPASTNMSPDKKQGGVSTNKQPDDDKKEGGVSTNKLPDRKQGGVSSYKPPDQKPEGSVSTNKQPDRKQDGGVSTNKAPDRKQTGAMSSNRSPDRKLTGGVSSNKSPDRKVEGGMSANVTRDNVDGKPCPPKPVRTGSKIKKTQILEHYEFSRQYYNENNEANEILTERYEIPVTNKGVTEECSPYEEYTPYKECSPYEEYTPYKECSPYEVPATCITKPRSKTELSDITQPVKPPRPNRNNLPGFVTLHKGDTWVKPYAVSPLHEEFTKTDKPVKPVIRAKPKPVRPAPPIPYKSKLVKSVSTVSPYAVSNVSFANNELKRKRERALDNYKLQLNDIEQQRNILEQRGVELEQLIRNNETGGSDGDDQLIEEWFSLVNDKDQLVRKESELVYMIRDIELIEEKEKLDLEIRQRLTKDNSTKSELEKAEEAAMIEELTVIVMKRDQLMWQFDEDKRREAEIEQSITKAMSDLNNN